jgi:hypothetical protein
MTIDVSKNYRLESYPSNFASLLILLIVSWSTSSMLPLAWCPPFFAILNSNPEYCSWLAGNFEYKIFGIDDGSPILADEQVQQL